MSRKNKRYKELITSNNLEIDEFNNIADGKQVVFPFSSAVPKVCNLIKDFLIMVNDYSRFAKKPDQHVSSTMERLLMEAHNCIILSMEESYSHSNVAQLVQIHQNITHFIIFIETELEKILVGYRYSSWIIKQTTSNVINSFKSTKENGEDMLIKLCKDKISAFLSLTLDVDWTPTNTRTEAHENIQDFAIYLGAIYQMLSPFSRELKHNLLSRIHSYMGSRLLSMMTDEITSYNVNAAKDIYTDVSFLVKIADKEGHIDSAKLGLREILETLHLLQQFNPDIFLSQREKQYSNISPETLERVLSK